MATITGKKVGATGFGLMSTPLTSTRQFRFLRTNNHSTDLTWRTTPVPDEQAFAAMKAALSSGYNFWNGGELYGTAQANSLHLLNRYFTKYPEDADKVVLSIKGGGIPGQMVVDGSEKNTRRSIDECLKVLDGKKYLDIFEAARVDPKVSLSETIGTIGQYVKEGKVGGISISEVTEDQIREAAKIHPIAACEVELSLHSTDILENGVATACGELGIPIVAYSPLGRGLLTAQISSVKDIAPDDIRHHLPRFAPDAVPKNAQMGQELQKLGKEKGCTPAQVALAWVRSLSGKYGYGVIIPIPGSTTKERAVENSKEITLNEDDLKEIEGIMQKHEVVGARYPTQWGK